MNAAWHNRDARRGLFALVIPQPFVCELQKLNLDAFEIEACGNIYRYLLGCDGGDTLSRMQEWLVDWVETNYIHHHPNLRYLGDEYTRRRSRSLQKLLYLSEKIWFTYDGIAGRTGTVEAIWRYALKVTIMYPDAVLVFLPGDTRQYIEIMSEHRTTSIGGPYGTDAGSENLHNQLLRDGYRSSGYSSIGC